MNNVKINSETFVQIYLTPSNQFNQDSDPDVCEDDDAASEVMHSYVLIYRIEFI